MPLLGGERMTRGSDTVDKNRSYSEFTPPQWISSDGQHDGGQGEAVHPEVGPAPALKPARQPTQGDQACQEAEEHAQDTRTQQMP